MSLSNDPTLSGWLTHHASITPDAIALSDVHGSMSYAALALAVAQMRSGLAVLGIGKGDVVGLQLPNTRDYVIALLAIASRGGTFQTLHMPYRAKELKMLLADSGARAVIVSQSDTAPRAQDVLSVRDDLPALEYVIVAGAPPPGTLPLSQVMEQVADPADRVPLNADDRFLLLYTSGTTAAPKGVPHAYRSFLNNARLSAGELQVSANSRILSLAPMTHLYGLFTLHLALSSGATTVLLPAFNPATLLQDLQTAQASHVFAAPAHFAPFVAQDAVQPEHLASVQLLCLSGAAVPQALAQAMDARLEQGKVIQLWGMSELQAGTFGRPTDPADKRFATAGAPVPGTELRVVDEAGQPLSAGQEGVLQVRGPSVFAGYLNRPQETSDAFRAEGWFDTGDLAILDPDGYLTLTGRSKELINRGGVKFNPIEVEEVINTLPGVQDCAMVPLPDATMGERGCLCVVLTPGTELTLEAVSALLDSTQMAKYKWPERMEQFDSLPMTPTRKVMRATLAQQVLARDS